MVFIFFFLHIFINIFCFSNIVTYKPENFSLHTTNFSHVQLPVDFTALKMASCLVQSQLQMTDAMENLEELLCLSGGDGQIFTVDGPLCMKTVQAMFG